MSSKLDTLFRPFSFGKVELSNRIVMAPMTRSQSPNSIPNDEVAGYYKRRAEGGVGLIVTEGTPPGAKGSHGYDNVPSFYGDEALAGWKKVVEEVHAAGGHIIPQVWHVGSMRTPGSGPSPADPVIGPSPVIHPQVAMLHEKAQPPVEMTQADIDACVEAFGQAAKDAEAIGMDGLEIHGAHSYLIDQFCWSVTNQRSDGYNGDLATRARFASEVVKAMRANVSDDFPIVFRYSQWKQGDYTHKMAPTPQELEAYLNVLCEAGVDVFHCSQRRFDEPEFEDSNLNLAGWTKKITGKATISVGSVGLESDFLGSFMGKGSTPSNIDALLERMENDEFDLIAIGRALLSDPAWPNKIKVGQDEEIKHFDVADMQVLT